MNCVKGRTEELKSGGEETQNKVMSKDMFIKSSTEQRYQIPNCSISGLYPLLSSLCLLPAIVFPWFPNLQSPSGPERGEPCHTCTTVPEKQSTWTKERQLLGSRELNLKSPDASIRKRRGGGGSCGMIKLSPRKDFLCILWTKNVMLIPKSISVGMLTGSVPPSIMKYSINNSII